MTPTLQPRPAPRPRSSATMYVPDRLPAPMPGHDGTFYGIAGIACSIAAIVFLPPLYGIAGLAFGILAIKKGEALFGFSAVVLAALGMMVGIGLLLFTDAHPEFMYIKKSEPEHVSPK